jgi:hypothetical protein
MRYLAIPGGWEGDARPDGGYVVALRGGQSLDTHLGPMVRPDGEPFRYPRLTPTGPLKIAGKDTRLREWVEGARAWRDVGPVPAAVSPVIYDQAGTLHVIDRARHDSASGWLYVAPDGTPRLVESSPWDRHGLDLHEWIDLGDGWVIGQGHDGGCWLRTPDGTYLAVVETADVSPTRDAMFIRAQRDGDAVAVCYYERPHPVAHLFWFRLSEAREVFPAFARPRGPVTYAPVVRIGRPLWFGFFEFTPAPALPANCRVPVVQGAPWLDVIGPGWSYVAGNPDGDVDAIGRAISEVVANAPGGPDILAYVPRRAQHALPTLAEIQGVEAYLGADETDADFYTRISASLAKCPRAVLIAQCYTSNTTLTSDLRRVPGLVAQLARDHANVEGILVFSGSGRATGWQDHPEVHDAWRQVFAGITGVPVVLPPLPPAPPQEHIPDTDTPAPPVVVPPPAPAPVPEEEPPVTTYSNALYPGEALLPGDERRDPTGRTRLVFQGDRNLVLYRDGTAVWSAQLAAYQPTDVVMQTDGNLVAYDAARTPVWNTGTDGHHGALLIVRDEDVVVALDGRVLWSSADTMVVVPPTKRPSRPARPSGSGGGLFAWLAGLFTRKPKPQRPLPNPEVPPAPPVAEPPAPSTPAIVLPPLRHRSIEDVRSVVLSGRHAHLLEPRHPMPFIRAVLAESDDPRWGLHMRPVGRHGEGVVAFNVPEPPGGAPYRIYDIVSGAMGESPTPSWLDQTGTMEAGSAFDPVTLDRVPSVLTLPRVRVEGTRFVTDRGAWSWIGATSFDLPSRIRIYGDLRWADWLLDEGFTLARIVPASKYRTVRALADGVRDLPRALAELAVRGLYAEVVIGVDTRDYGMGEAGFKSYAIDILDICEEYSNSLVEFFNEPTHGTHDNFARDEDFHRYLVGLARGRGIACASGSTHGGEAVRWTIGDYLTHHADRGRSPGANAVEMAHAQVIAGKPIVDDEPLGTAEVDQPGRRTADAAYAAEQGAACRLHRLGGATYHTEAGLTANVDLLGPIQREAARRFVSARKGL